MPIEVHGLEVVRLHTTFGLAPGARSAPLQDRAAPKEPARSPPGVVPPGAQRKMAELGRAALVVTLGLCLYATVAGSAAAWTRRRRLAHSARNALIASFGSTLIAAAVLAAGFLRNDFSLSYVAEHSNRSLGGVYKLSAIWGGQEGSTAGSGS